MKFEGTQSYVATDDLKLAVNAAITLQRPLLVKGEPGTGKTMLAEQLAESFGARLITWHIKSTTKAHQGLYEYDAVSRLRDSQLDSDKVHDVRNYIKKGKLWEAFTSEKLPVLLIDEIDKADIEFPNDLLTELDRMEFDVYETGERIKATQRIRAQARWQQARPLAATVRQVMQQALLDGRWVKVIGGASNQDLEALEDLAGLFTLAGVHCLDVAADFGVVAAVKRGIDWALNQGVPRRPWLMLSLNDGADPHFRKAVFDPQLCPSRISGIPWFSLRIILDKSATCL